MSRLKILCLGSAVIGAAVGVTPCIAEANTVLIFSNGTAPIGNLCGAPSAKHVQRLVLENEFAQLPGPPPALVHCESDSDRVAADAGDAVTGIYKKDGAVQYSRAAGVSRSMGGTQRYTLLVLSNPTAGNDLAYRHWYDSNHLPAVLRNPGFISAQRYTLISSGQGSKYHLPEYAALYSFVSSDLKRTEDEVLRRIKSGETPMSTAFDYPSSVTRYYKDCDKSGDCKP